MARKTYPSDEARKKVGAHVKIFLTVANHPRYGMAWADLETRGIICGLWLQAAAGFAAKSGDVIFLPSAQVCWITGREKVRAALITLARACRTFDYPVLFHLRGEPQRGWSESLHELVTTSRDLPDGPQTVPSGAVAASVLVRNFAKKQGWNSALGGVTPRTPDPSELRITNREKKSGVVRSRRSQSEPDSFTVAEVNALPEDFFERLAEERPDLPRGAAGARTWLRSVVGSMREAGKYTSLRKTAAAWWRRAHGDDVRVALEREYLAEAKRQAAAIPKPPPPEPEGEVEDFFSMPFGGTT